MNITNDNHKNLSLEEFTDFDLEELYLLDDILWVDDYFDLTEISHFEGRLQETVHKEITTELGQIRALGTCSYAGEGL